MSNNLRNTQLSMQRLVIPVNETVASVWQRSGLEQRAKIVRLFCWLVEQEQWEHLTPDTFAQLLDRVSDQATANGLTPDVLEALLRVTSKPAFGSGAVRVQLAADFDAPLEDFKDYQ